MQNMSDKFHFKFIKMAHTVTQQRSYDKILGFLDVI